MAFTDSQIRKLKSKLKPQHVRVREPEGQALHYLEGWHVVAEANRIFGFDAWDRETVSNACVWTKQCPVATALPMWRGCGSRSGQGRAWSFGRDPGLENRTRRRRAKPMIELQRLPKRMLPNGL